MANAPPTNLLATTTNILQKASEMGTVPRFLHLLQHAKLLIQTYGPYTTTHSKSTLFVRSQNGNHGTQEITSKLLASSLAAAQDCSDSTQPPFSAHEDLAFFKELWSAAIAVLESIIDARSLSSETLGWGLLGLCSGYMRFAGDRGFNEQKSRLENVLKFLPRKDRVGTQWSIYYNSMWQQERPYKIQKKIQSEAHFVSMMLVQRFKGQGWARIRWWQVVAVAERWVEHLGLGPAVTEDVAEARKEPVTRTPVLVTNE